MIVILTLIPLAVLVALRDPVEILSLGGIISAAHMPFVVFLTLYLNRTRLPRELRPGVFWFTVMVLVGLYYAFFAGFYFYDLLFGPSRVG